MNNPIEFNAAAITLAVYQQDASNANGVLQAHLGGAVVEEYDKQIQIFTADLVANNVEKSLIRNEKVELTEYMASSKDYSAKDAYVMFSNGQAITESNGKVSYYEGKANPISQMDLAKLNQMAKQYGYEFTDLPKNGNSYLLTEEKLIAFQDKLDAKLSDLNSISEMKMIKFQSLMDARKQAMMMLSNMISSDNQTKMSIIQNMKG